MIEMEIASSGSESGGKIWRMFFNKTTVQIQGAAVKKYWAQAQNDDLKFPTGYMFMLLFFFLIASFFGL